MLTQKSSFQNLQIISKVKEHFIMANYKVYQFYAELNNFKPKIWRRFQVVADITVAQFGYILQVLFEMMASHLMMIEVPKGKNILMSMQADHPKGKNRAIGKFDIDHIVWRYDIINEYFEPPDYLGNNIKSANALEVKLNQAVCEPKEMLDFNYDFGDAWLVSVKLEKVFVETELPKSEYPRVLEGWGFGIVEDCGGTYGLNDLVKAFEKKKGNKYKQYSEWMGVEDFDISHFDSEDMNFRLKKIPRIYKQIYEEGLAPTKKSVDLIERKYLKKPKK